MSMRPTLVVLLILFLTSLMPTDATAYGGLAYIGVYPDETGTTCEFTGGGGGFSVAYVVLTNSIPLKSISFRAPVPGCLGGSQNFLFDSSPFSLTGDSQTGITVDLGGCTTSPVTLLTITYVAASPAGCCYWEALPYTGNYPETIEFLDCNDVVRPGESAVVPTVDQCCVTFDVLQPYEPYPANGATGVSTEVVLNWLLPDERCTEFVYFSTEPPTPFFPPCCDEGSYFTSYDPGTLQPNTTYYWQVFLQCSYDTGSASDVWSFTTGDGTLAAEQSTWGGIKALYVR